MEEYDEKIRCRNCGKSSLVGISKGTLKSDINTDDIKCPHCGCKGDCNFTV